VLLEASPAWLRPIVSVDVATGMRRGEYLDSDGLTRIVGLAPIAPPALICDKQHCMCGSASDS
jgi:hypothetical protein